CGAGDNSLSGHWMF
nr:immunoglobulin light chain junction region [Macaca mulatta]